MDLDPRWGDDARDRGGTGLERSPGSRGAATDTSERDASPDLRDVFTRDLNLPRGLEREHVRVRDHYVTLRGSEVRTLATVGAFRVVPAGDLRDGDGRPLDPRSGDLKHLRREGLVQTIPVRGPDRALVVLTEKGRNVLESHRRDRDWSADGDPERRDDRQTFYAGVQRPRELTHDAQVQRAYEREAERLREEADAIIRCVKLDTELKREYQAFLQEHNRGRRDSDGRPDRSPEEVSRWAAEHDLPCRDGHVQFPDARIVYEDRDGLLHTLDLEVETVHYRGAHAAAKRASGFSCHGGSSMRVVDSRGSVGGRRSPRGTGGTGAGSGSGHGPNPRLAEELLR